MNSNDRQAIILKIAQHVRKTLDKEPALDHIVEHLGSLDAYHEIFDKVIELSEISEEQ